MNGWWELFETEAKKDYFVKLQDLLKGESGEYYPEEKDIFNAFLSTPYEDVKVVIMGDEPYADGSADGLAFSAREGEKASAALKNIFKELNKDIGGVTPKKDTLAPWAERGVLLLNSVLTVHKDEPGSHADSGWDKFTDSALELLNKKKTPVVFMFFGKKAKKKAEIITKKTHLVITGTNPASGKGFLGTKPFSKANEFLGKNAVNWKL